MLPAITPAKLARSLEPFDDKDWLFELKHDGFRSLAYLEDGRCRLVSRHRNVYKSFETLRIALAGLQAESAILDGEIVCPDAEGCSQFKELLYRRGRAVIFAFDLVWLDDVDLRQTPLFEREMAQFAFPEPIRFKSYLYIDSCIVSIEADTMLAD